MTTVLAECFAFERVQIDRESALPFHFSEVQPQSNLLDGSVVQKQACLMRGMYDRVDIHCLAISGRIRYLKNEGCTEHGCEICEGIGEGLQHPSRKQREAESC
jgi:hypothetical protein